MKLDLIKENIHSTQANIINNNKDIDLIKYSELITV